MITKSVHENSRFPCRENNFNKTFTNQSSHQIHEMKHKKEKTKMCDQCCKLFYHESELKNHQLIHGLPSFACDKCNTKFTQKSERNRHSKTCGTQAQCSQYPKYFTNTKYLEEHISTKHVNSETWRYVCEICPTKNQNFNTIPHFGITTVNIMYKILSKHVYHMLLCLFLSDCKI